jgi:gluconate 2-dehydrogenase gamma chain
LSSPESVKNTRVNRRDLLLGAIFLVGGAAALSRLTAKSPAGLQASGGALAGEHFALLEQVSEVIIPATETPGAIAAGVPAFMREMLENWSSPETRTQLLAVLDGIEKLAWQKFGAGFLALAPERRLDVLTAYDADSMAKHDSAYGRFKYLVLVGYYQSEAGATQELRFELVPGEWRACVPLNEVGRASAI